MHQTSLNIRLTPNAKRNQVIGGIDNSSWSIKIAAPPVEGKANRELVKYLSSILDIGKSYVIIQKGQNSRCKLVLIEGLDPDEVARRLSLAQG